MFVGKCWCRIQTLMLHIQVQIQTAGSRLTCFFFLFFFLLLAWRTCSPLWRATTAAPPNRAAFRPSHWLSPSALHCWEGPSSVGLLSSSHEAFTTMSRGMIGLKNAVSDWLTRPFFLFLNFRFRFYFEAANLWCPSWHHLFWGQHLLGGESETSS